MPGLPPPPGPGIGPAGPPPLPNPPRRYFVSTTTFTGPVGTFCAVYDPSSWMSATTDSLPAVLANVTLPPLRFCPSQVTFPERLTFPPPHPVTPTAAATARTRPAAQVFPCARRMRIP